MLLEHLSPQACNTVPQLKSPLSALLRVWEIWAITISLFKLSEIFPLGFPEQEVLEILSHLKMYIKWNLYLTKSPNITNNFLQRGQNYSLTYGTEPRYNEFLVISNIIRKSKRKIYLDVTNYCQHATEDEHGTMQLTAWKFFNPCTSKEDAAINWTKSRFWRQKLIESRGKSQTHLCLWLCKRANTNQSYLNTQPQYNEQLGRFPSNSLYRGNRSTNPRFNEQIHPVPSDFVKSRLHCI